jgi:uncharacterized membrane protein YkoI
MRNIGRWIVAGALAFAGLSGSALANHGENESGHAHQKTSLSELPSAVRATFQKEAKGGDIQELRSETRNGKTIYEGEVVNNGKGSDIQVSADGTVLGRSAPHDEATEGEHEK